MAPPSVETSNLGNILVVGGCGFLGYHLTSSLLNEAARGEIHVASRNPTQNLLDGVIYHALDITDASAIQALIRKVRPRTIFNVASPVSSDMYVDQRDFDRVNIGGMENILMAARSVGSMRALVSTSTTHPYLIPGVGGRPYYHSKVAQEKMLLAANSAELATVSLRLCLLYGERDVQFVPRMLEAVYGKKTNVQLGENKKKIDTCSAQNAATAHILAARALLDPSRANGPVGGEAFNITDGNPTPFWDIARIIFRAAGDTTDPSSIVVIPGWLAKTMANVTEWAYFMGTFGIKKPQNFNMLIVIHIVNNFTYSIEKAKRTLGYHPTPDLEGELEAAVRFEEHVNPRK